MTLFEIEKKLARGTYIPYKDILQYTVYLKEEYALLEARYEHNLGVIEYLKEERDISAT